MCMIKLSASEISSLLEYNLRIGGFTNSFLQKAVNQGKIAHSRNGFTNTTLFTRFYKLGKWNIKLTGMPDKVDEDFVYEFKTYHSPRAKVRNKKVGKVQLLVYEFLTGLPGKLVLYDIQEDKITDTINIPFNSKEFRKILKKALKLKLMIQKFKNDFKTAQESL